MFFFLTVLINAAMNIDIQIFESLLSVLLGTYPGVELLDQMALFTCFRNQKAFFFPALELCLNLRFHTLFLNNIYSFLYPLCTFYDYAYSYGFGKA